MCTVAWSKKKKKLFNQTSLFLFFIHFIKSGHSFTLILTLSRSSLIPLKLHSLNVAAIVKLTPVRYNLLPFFFFSNPVSFTLIHSFSFTVISHLKPLKLTLSTSPPSSSSLRSLKLTLLTLPARPLSTSPPSSSSDPRRRSASDALLFRWSTSGQLSLSSSCDALGFWFGYNILFRQSAYPLWVFDLDPLHVDVSVFYFWLLFWIIGLVILCYEISFCFVLAVLSW